MQEKSQIVDFEEQRWQNRRQRLDVRGGGFLEAQERLDSLERLEELDALEELEKLDTLEELEGLEGLEGLEAQQRAMAKQGRKP